MNPNPIKPASPLPWKLCNDADGWLFVFDSTGVEVFATKIKHDPFVDPLEEADHTYIVAACSAYPALVEALQKIAGYADTQGAARDIQKHMAEIARAALEAAKESPR